MVSAKVSGWKEGLYMSELKQVVMRTTMEDSI